jgi:hypothetical protein
MTRSTNNCVSGRLFWYGELFCRRKLKKRPEGTPKHAHPGIYHFAPAKYHISARKYITFPPGKISPGAANFFCSSPCAGRTVTFYTLAAAKSTGTLYSLSPKIGEVFLHTKNHFPLFLRRKMWYTGYKNLFWG